MRFYGHERHVILLYYFHDKAENVASIIYLSA